MDPTSALAFMFTRLNIFHRCHHHFYLTDARFQRLLANPYVDVNRQTTIALPFGVALN